MKKLNLLLIVLLFAFSAFSQNLTSPGGNLSLSFKLTAAGEPVYQLAYKGKVIIKESKMWFVLKDQPPLQQLFTVIETKTGQRDESWNPVWGEVKTIRNNYRELAVTLHQAVGFDAVGDNLSKEPKKITRKIVIRFRLFDDGLGFRYEFPVQDELKYFTVADEKTEFNLTGDHKTFWIPGDYDTNEYAYNTTLLSQIDATKGKNVTEISTRALFSDNAVQTPLMLKSAEGLYINIHEAALVNYPAMYMMVDRKSFGLTSHLAPNAVGSAAFLQTPARTPWRTVIVSDKASEILASKLILNLNEPTKIQDTSWIKPQKMVGVWWEMHVGTGSWNYAEDRKSVV